MTRCASLTSVGPRAGRLLVLVGLLALTGLASGGHILWTDPGTDDWNDGTNWSAGVPGAGDTAEIGEGAGNGGTAVISSAAPNIVNLRLGESAGETGHLEILTGGSLTTTSGDLLVGANGTGAGTITMSGGSLTMNNGRLELGQNGVGTVTMTDGLFTVTNSHVVMGRHANADATIDISGGTLQTTGGGNRNFYMAWDNAASQAALNVSGTGHVDVAGGEFNLCGSGTATVTQTGGSVNAAGIVYVGRNATSVGTYDISDGTLDAHGLRLAWHQTGSQGTLKVSGDAQINLTAPLEGCGNGIGLIEQTGGTITLTDTYPVIGRYNTGTATYNLSGGVLKTVGTGAGANHRFHMAWDHANNHATLNLSGTGQVIVNEDRAGGNAGFLIGNQGIAEVNVSDSASITVYGGTDGEGGMSLGLNGNATGTVNQSGGAVTIYDNYLMIGRRSTTTGTYNISGGTLETAGAPNTTARIYMGWDHAGATGYLNLSGDAAVTTNRDNASDVNGGFYAGERGTAYITIADNASLTINAGKDGEGMTLGRRDNAHVTVTQTGGTVTVNDQYFIMGRWDNSSGIYNISGGVLQTAGTIAGDNRRMHLAWDSVNATAEMHVSGNGQVIVNADNVSGSTGFHIAERGTADITVSDNGSITVYGRGDGEGGMLLGRHGTATLTQTGGSVTVRDNYLIIGRWDNATGVYDISGGTLQTAGTTGNRNIYLGWDGAGTHGTLNVSGTGAVSTTNGALFVSGNGTGTVNQAGGSVTTNNNYVMIGRSNGSVGTYNISAGTLQTAGAGGDRNIYLAWDGATSQGSLNVSATGAVTGANDLYVGGNGAGTVNQTGGSVTASRMVMLAKNPGSTGTYNLNGGTLTAKLIAKGDGTASFNFGGGTLKAGAAFASNVPMTFNAGGANINTNGNEVTLSGALAGSGGLNKIGAGTLTLAGANSYAGATHVNQGTLRVGVGVPSVAGPPGGIALWLDAADSSTMTFNGTQVSEWRDKAGGSDKVSQADVGRLPDYVPAGIHGNPVLHFTASEEDTLTNATDYPAPATVLYVGRQTAGTKARVLTSVTNNWLLGYHGGAVNRAYFEGWVTGGGDWQPSDDDPHIFTGLIPGSPTHSAMYTDGILIASNTGGTTGPNGLSLNGWHANTQFSDCEYGELLIYDRALTDAERLAAEAYLRGKWFPALNAIPDGSAVTIAGGATLDLNDFDETIGSLAGGAGSQVQLGAGTLTTGGNGDNTAFAGVIAGTGGLVKEGGGAMTLSGTNLYTGDTAIHDGALLLAGSVAGDVIVNPGGTLSAGASPGHGIIGGAYAQDGTMLAELGGTAQGATTGGYDWIEVEASATLGGIVDVDFVDGFASAWALGDYFDILTAARGITDPDLSGVAFDFSDAQTGFVWWTSIVPLGGGAEALRLQIAPEPATLTLLALGLLPVLRRRKRR